MPVSSREGKQPATDRVWVGDCPGFGVTDKRCGLKFRQTTKHPLFPPLMSSKRLGSCLISKSINRHNCLYQKFTIQRTKQTHLLWSTTQTHTNRNKHTFQLLTKVSDLLGEWQWSFLYESTRPKQHRWKNRAVLRCLFILGACTVSVRFPVISPRQWK